MQEQQDAKKGCKCTSATATQILVPKGKRHSYPPLPTANPCENNSDRNPIRLKLIQNEMEVHLVFLLGIPNVVISQVHGWVKKSECLDYKSKVV